MTSTSTKKVYFLVDLRIGGVGAKYQPRILSVTPLAYKFKGILSCERVHAHGDLWCGCPCDYLGTHILPTEECMWWRHNRETSLGAKEHEYTSILSCGCVYTRDRQTHRVDNEIQLAVCTHTRVCDLVRMPCGHTGRVVYNADTNTYTIKHRLLCVCGGDGTEYTEDTNTNTSIQCNMEVSYRIHGITTDM